MQRRADGSAGRRQRCGERIQSPGDIREWIRCIDERREREDQGDQREQWSLRNNHEPDHLVNISKGIPDKKRRARHADKHEAPFQ